MTARVIGAASAIGANPMISELSAQDCEYLRQSASDLSDICPCRLAQIQRDFAQAYERAAGIRTGRLDPLSI
jgi:hypothetical protein